MTFVQGSPDFGVYGYATSKPANGFVPELWMFKDIVGIFTCFKGVVRGVRITAILKQLKTYGPIKKTGIQKREAIMLCQRLGDGTLPGRGRTVDCNYHGFADPSGETDELSSPFSIINMISKLGKLVAIGVTSSTVTPL